MSGIDFFLIAIGVICGIIAFLVLQKAKAKLVNWLSS